MDTAKTRRQFLRISALAASGLALTACGNQVAQDKTKETKEQDEKGAEVTATEDLMHEHGVLRQRCWSTPRPCRSFAAIHLQ